jgi:hypothetical protein
MGFALSGCPNKDRRWPMSRIREDAAADPAQEQCLPKTSAATIAARLSELIETHMLKCDEAFPHPDDCPAHVISELHDTQAWIQSVGTSSAGACHLIELSLDDGTSFNIRVEEV